MEKLEEVVNAIAETVMLHAGEYANAPDSSILAGAMLDLEDTGHLGRGGFVLRLSDGSRFEVRLAQVR